MLFLNNIYIDEDFNAATLEDLKRQVVAAAEEAWYRHVQDEALQTLRDLTREPAPPGCYDLNDSSVADLWVKMVVEEISKPSKLITLKE